LVFLAFSTVNQLNVSTQGKGKIILCFADEIVEFKSKIQLWIHRMKSGMLAACLIVEEKDIDWTDILKVFLNIFKDLLLS